MRRAHGECSCLTAAVAFALLSPGCTGYGRRTGAAPWYERTAYSWGDFPDTFGYLSLGRVVHAEFFEGSEGLEPGAGITGTVPVTPGGAVIVALILLMALIAESGGDLSGLDFGGSSGGGGSGEERAGTGTCGSAAGGTATRARRSRSTPSTSRSR